MRPGTGATVAPHPLRGIAQRHRLFLVADLTILATEKVTRKTLTSEDQRRLVDEAVAELDFAALSGEER